MTHRRGRLYAHVLNWPQGELRIPGLRSTVEKAYLLADNPGMRLTVQSDESGITIALPEVAPDPNVSVVVLEIGGQVKVDPEATGKRHWNIGTGVQLNREKIERQRKLGWTPMKDRSN